MQITLKQKQVEAALRLYILAQGISLVGKTVNIAFTAGRKEAGMTAEVFIDGDNELGAAHTQAEAALAQAEVRIFPVKADTPVVSPTPPEPVAVFAPELGAPHTEVLAPVGEPVAATTGEKKSVSLFS